MTQKNPAIRLYWRATFDTAAGTLPSTYAGLIPARNDPGDLLLYGTPEVINGYLQELQFEPTPDYDQSFVITWLLTNPVSALETTAVQNVNIGQTNDEIQDMELTRSYSENQYGLIFPTSVPYIPETVVGAVYTAIFTLTGNIGVIGFGENFTTPAGWNDVLKTYTFTGTKAQLQNMFATVKFFPFANINSNATVNYEQRRNGQFQLQRTFTLAGVPFATRIQGTGNYTVNEDTTVNVGLTAVYPNWDTGSWAVVLQTERNSAPVSDVGNFTLLPGWSYIGTAQTHSGIYKNFVARNSVTDFENDLNTVTDTQIALKADYDTDYTQVRTINMDGTFDGSTFVGGTQYNANAAVTVSGSAEYEIPASLTYIEDLEFSFSGFAVTDAAVGKNYSATVELVNAAVGNLYYNSINYGNSITITGDKSTVTTNLNNIKFLSVLNGYANTTLLYSQTQTTDNIVQASNLSIPFNSTGNQYDPTFNAGFYLLDVSGNYTGVTPITNCHWTTFPYFDFTAVGIAGTGNQIGNIAVTWSSTGQPGGGDIITDPAQVSTVNTWSTRNRYRNYHESTGWTVPVTDVYQTYQVSGTGTTTGGQFADSLTYNLTVWNDVCEFEPATYWATGQAPVVGQPNFGSITADPKRGSSPVNSATYHTPKSAVLDSGVYTLSDNTNIYNLFVNAAGFGWENKTVEATIVVSDIPTSEPVSSDHPAFNWFGYNLATGAVTGDVAMFNAVGGSITMQNIPVFSKTPGATTTTNSIVPAADWVSVFRGYDLLTDRVNDSRDLSYVTEITVPTAFVNTAAWPNINDYPLTVRLQLKFGDYGASGPHYGPAPITPIFTEFTKTFSTYWSK